MQPSAPEIVDFTRFEALGARDIVCKEVRDGAQHNGSADFFLQLFAVSI